MIHHRWSWCERVDVDDGVCHENTISFVALCFRVLTLCQWGMADTADDARTIDKSKTMDKIINKKMFVYVCVQRFCGVERLRRQNLSFGFTFVYLCSTTKMSNRLRCVFYVLPALIIIYNNLLARSKRLHPHAFRNEDLWDAIKSNCHNVRRSIDKRFFFRCFVRVNVYVFHCVASTLGFLWCTCRTYKLQAMKTECALQSRAPQSNSGNSI